MGILSKPNCIGVFIDASGKCVVSKAYLIAKKYKLDKLESFQILGEQEKDGLTLARLVAEMDPNDETVVIASKCNLGTVVDLSMPKLANENMRNALLFELPKLIPVSEEGVVWGFKQIGENATGMNVRLGIIASEKWQELLGLLSYIKCGIEMVLPLSMTLDPLLSDVSLCENEEDGICFVKQENGLRIEEVLPDNNETFLNSLSDSFDLSILEGEVDAAVAHSFLLAAYGLTAGVRRDKKSWITLPSALATKKKHSLFALNLCLLFIFIALGGYSFWNYYQQQRLEQQLYQAYLTKFTNDTKNIGTVNNDEIFIKKVEKEMDEILRNRRGLASNLSSLSELLDKSIWVDRLSWNGEKFVLDMFTDSSQTDVAMELQQSGLFDNISLKRNTSNIGREALTLEFSVVEKKNNEETTENTNSGVKQ